MLKQIDEAFIAEKLRLEQTRSDSYAENEDELDDAPSEVGRGAPRVCKAPDTFKLAVLEATQYLRRDLQVMQNYAAPCESVC